MRTFKVHHFRQKNSVPFVSLFNGAIELLNSNNIIFNKTLFFSEGSPRSSDRILKRYPELLNYVYYSANPHTRLISNLNEDWEVSTYGDWDEFINYERKDSPLDDTKILSAIAEGIPRSYPVSSIFYIIDQIDWFNKGQIEQPTRPFDHKVSTLFPFHYLSPSIGVTYSWEGRHVWAVIEVSSEEEMVDDVNLNLLKSTFGKVMRTDTFTILNSDEKSAVKEIEERSRLVVKKYTYYKDLSKQLPYPSEGLDSTDISMKVILGLAEKISPKKSLIKAFKGTGYTYRGYDYGGYTISKVDSYHNNIEVEFILAPTARVFECTLKYQSHLHSVSLGLPIAQTIHNQNDADQFFHNAKCHIEYLENTFIEELREVYGPGKPWYRYY
ncbi:hypothetical protein D3C76_559360 [compost metagenome]